MNEIVYTLIAYYDIFDISFADDAAFPTMAPAGMILQRATTASFG